MPSCPAPRCHLHAPWHHEVMSDPSGAELVFTATSDKTAQATFLSALDGFLSERALFADGSRTGWVLLTEEEAGPWSLHLPFSGRELLEYFVNDSVDLSKSSFVVSEPTPGTIEVNCTVDGTPYQGVFSRLSLEVSKYAEWVGAAGTGGLLWLDGLPPGERRLGARFGVLVPGGLNAMVGWDLSSTYDLALMLLLLTVRYDPEREPGPVDESPLSRLLMRMGEEATLVLLDALASRAFYGDTVSFVGAKPVLQVTFEYYANMDDVGRSLFVELLGGAYGVPVRLFLPMYAACVGLAVSSPEALRFSLSVVGSRLNTGVPASMVVSEVVEVCQAYPGMSLSQLEVFSHLWAESDPLGRDVHQLLAVACSV